MILYLSMRLRIWRLREETALAGKNKTMMPVDWTVCRLFSVEGGLGDEEGCSDYGVGQ